MGRTSRNGFMLNGMLGKNGYDWWWHSLVAINKKTKKPKPFFIEYFVINPALGTGKPAIPKGAGKPSFAMIKAGAWGKDARQINNFFAISEFRASREKMDIKIGRNIATETRLSGSVQLSEKDAEKHPEYRSDTGKMVWDLSVKKILPYSVGYGTSRLFRSLNAFRMFWHIQGMKCEYSGRIFFDGEEYMALPEKSFGYQDKNWGSDYTNPWVWLSCNNIRRKGGGKALKMASLVAGGGTPVFFGIPIKRKIVVAFYYEGKLYEFNFSKFWQLNRQEFGCKEDKKYVYWSITASNIKNKIEINFACEKEKMLFINYLNPKGEMNHTRLWNGGDAKGTIKLYARKNFKWQLIEEFICENGGCEYGEY